MFEFIGESKQIETKHLMPLAFRQNNDIVEEGQYYVINGKHKIKKVKFFDLYFGDEDAIKQVNESLQGGYLYITNDYQWISRCSDKKGGWTSWASCFRPGGEYDDTRDLYADSDNIWMAMILNKSKTKIIGRRFIIVPEEQDRAVFLKHYGTWPEQFNSMLFDWVGNNLLENNEYNIAEYAFQYGYFGWHYDKQCYDDIWVDNISYAIYNNGCHRNIPAIVNLGRHQVLYNDSGYIKTTFIAGGSTALYHRDVNVLDFNKDNIDEVAANVLSGNIEYPKTSVAEISFDDRCWRGADPISLINIDGYDYLVVYDNLQHTRSIVKTFCDKLIELNVNNKQIALYTK